MVTIDYEFNFKKVFKKINNHTNKEKVRKQIKKIVANPEIGKPMRYGRKGTRELYVKPFRISYAFLDNENKIIFLDLYHKDQQ
ncbi:type II toxin-antitoxin system RelE/ParE family toxin [Candidatus Woesearchaeota archaeon]|nr:type II toxin-antitoxin system RelE/ParE family toxin [Candidatus Woesearchaeota archaeon]